MESPSPSRISHHRRRPTMYSSPSKPRMSDAEHDVRVCLLPAIEDPCIVERSQGTQNGSQFNRYENSSDGEDINKATDSGSTPSSITSRRIPRVEITAPVDYFGFTPGIDPIQPVQPPTLESAKQSTPPTTSAQKNATSPDQAPLPSLPHPTTLSSRDDMQTLTSALSIIRNHLFSLDTAIKQNISSQSLAQSSVSKPKKSLSPIHETSSIDTPQSYRANPGFKANDANTSGAVLDTAKVCCVLERSLEALIDVLKIGKEGEENDTSKGEGKAGVENRLMRICVQNGGEVKKVMGSAIQGVKSVVDFDGRKLGSG